MRPLRAASRSMTCPPDGRFPISPTRLAVRSSTADRTNPWWASVGCADREPAAARLTESRVAAGIAGNELCLNIPATQER